MGEQDGSFKRNLIFVLAITILGGVALGIWQFREFNDGKLHLVFCDVGQGDAVYLKTPGGKEILIDGGPDDKVLNCLSSRRPFYDRKIEAVVLTHPEADHLTGLIPVLKGYKVDNFVTENIFNSSAVFSEFRQAIISEETRIYNPKVGDRMRFGETEIDFYWPENILGKKDLWLDKSVLGSQITSGQSGSSNDYSLVLTVSYKNFKVFLSGDAEKNVLEKIGNLPSQVSILKVPHHGSKDALSKSLLEILNPRLAVISVGKGNQFGHPNEQTLKFLQDSAVKSLRTDQNGTIEIISDGKDWKIKGN